MNEVEKMYENAGIKKDLYCCDGTCGEPTKRCKDCPDYSEIYPPFTAEKQLELIKWMIKTNHRYFIQDLIIEDFPETLAGVFNLYWQDLTEEERTQIKEVLNG